MDTLFIVVFEQRGGSSRCLTKTEGDTSPVESSRGLLGALRNTSKYSEDNNELTRSLCNTRQINLIFFFNTAPGMVDKGAAADGMRLQ